MVLHKNYFISWILISHKKKKTQYFYKIDQPNLVKSREKFGAKSKKSEIKIHLKWRYVHWAQPHFWKKLFHFQGNFGENLEMSYVFV